MKTETPRKMALLIDADNLSPNDVQAVFDYLDKSGYLMPVRRAYGGYEKLSGMKDVLRQRSVRALVNQGKGTTDVSLVVDAMDLLHGSQLPSTVAIVSSDADFAPLALRLREADICVLCFANRLNATPNALAIAYDKVIFVDDLQKPTSEGTGQFDKTGISASGSDGPISSAVVDKKAEKVKSRMRLPSDGKEMALGADKLKPKAALVETVLGNNSTQMLDDPLTVSRILEVLPGWLPNTVINLNQMGGPLRSSGIAKGNKPLHELFRKHPGYFKVVPTTGPAKQIKLLKLPS